MIDPQAAFIRLLLDDSTFSAFVQGRVRGTPPGLNQALDFDPTTKMPKKSIAVQQVTAAKHITYPTMMPMFYLIAYGATANEAVDVLRKLSDVLYDAKGQVICNRMIHSTWFLYWAHMETGPNPSIEPQSNWPVAYATVRAKFDALRGA